MGLSVSHNSTMLRPEDPGITGILSVDLSGKDTDSSTMMFGISLFILAFMLGVCVSRQVLGGKQSSRGQSAPYRSHICPDCVDSLLTPPYSTIVETDYKEPRMMVSKDDQEGNRTAF